MKMIATDKAPKALGPYSQGCVHNGMLYSAGQIAINPITNAIEATDIVGQTCGHSVFMPMEGEHLRMYTCYGGYNGRWIVIAEKVS